jgi:hypothetical protein
MVTSGLTGSRAVVDIEDISPTARRRRNGFHPLLTILWDQAVTTTLRPRKIKAAQKRKGFCEGALILQGAPKRGHGGR